MASIGDTLECGRANCDRLFTLDSATRKYCDEHMTVDATGKRQWIAYDARAIRGDEILPERNCKICGGPIPDKMRADAMYCRTKCKVRARTIARRKRNIEYTVEQSEAPESGTQGKVYHRLVNEGYARAIADREMTAASAARILGVTQAAVSKAMGTFRQKEALDAKESDWQMDPLYAWMLPHDLIGRLEAIGLDQEGQPEFERILSWITEAIWVFQHRFFTIGSRGKRMIVRPFHEEIMREFVIDLVFGEKSLVNTPPRTGKSEVLIRAFTWLLLLYPNYQIGWIAANTDLASKMIKKVRATFEFSRDLREAFLPPGKIFGSKRTSDVWNESEFILETRTDYTLTHPSLVGLGSTSTIAGRNMDFIGIDDLEERKTVATNDLRQTTREKHAEIMERKEDHTGVMNIGSRQHLDDIPHRLAEQTGDEAWRILEYSAHADWCTLDPDDARGHDTNGCLLFGYKPKIRNYRWLLNEKAKTEALGLPGRFQLRYLQKAVPIEGTIFEIPTIRIECLDRSRVAGSLEELGTGTLIGGLDPAARSYQAAFCWMWTPETLYMIDLEVQKAGGFAGAIEIMRRWNKSLNLDLWVYEDNSQQIEFFRDPRIAALKDELNLTILDHSTGKNKHDPELGISSMAPWYHSGKINLPYGNGDSRHKVEMLLSQLELWTDSGISKRGKSDVKMASWLPFPRIVRWDARESDDAGGRATVRSDGYPMSYADLEGFSTMNQAPWR